MHPFFMQLVYLFITYYIITLISGSY